MALVPETAFAPLREEEICSAPSLRGADDPWRALMPVPDDAPKLTRAIVDHHAPDGYAFSKAWPYLDGTGRLLGFAARYDGPTNGAKADKEVKPLTFWQGQCGRQEWRCKAFPEPRPLYGLDALAARPEAPVIVVEGEKKVGPAVAQFPGHVAVTSPGGANAARRADWAPLSGRHVIIWPDADCNGAGKRYAENVAEMLCGVGAASVRIVKVPETFPDGWDLADTLPEGVTDEDLARMLAEAAPATSHGPLPLFPPLPAPEPYPVEALGPVLSRAAFAIARKVQVPEAIAAQSVLAVASLAAQAHADVRLPFGQTRPLSLYIVTVAGSGDRKTTADNEALWPIRKREKALKEEHERAFKAWAIAHTAWSAEKRKIEGSSKFDLEGRKRALADLGPEPHEPLKPFLTAPDPTVEGLAKNWPLAPASLGIFTAEGGQFVGGHGMSQDHRLKSAATYSEIWDGRPIKRVRAGDGVTILQGRRLAMHLMVQQDVAARFLSDPVLRDQGLLSRVLVAAPDSIAGTRFYRDAAPDDEVAIRAYGARLLSILEAPTPLAEGKPNELAPRTLPISHSAEAAWRAFYNHVEGQCGRGADLGLIQDFAAKAAEHAARIAGVLTIVEDLHVPEIGLAAMAGALTLMDWYINEALRLQGAARTDPRLLRAQQLLEWMQAQGRPEIEFRDILRRGPHAVRTKVAAEEALLILADHGWTAEVSRRPRRVRVITGE